MSKQKRTFDKKNAVRDILYEIRIFLETTEDIIILDEVSPELLEPRLLHTRNLIEFFGKGKKNYVVAADYADEFEKQNVNFPNHDMPTELNNYLAHITDYRVETQAAGQKEWPLKETVLPLLEPCENFIRHLIDNEFVKDDGNDWNDWKMARHLLEVIAELRARIDNLQSEPRHTQKKSKVRELIEKYANGNITLEH